MPNFPVGAARYQADFVAFARGDHEWALWNTSTLLIDFIKPMYTVADLCDHVGLYLGPRPYTMAIVAVDNVRRLRHDANGTWRRAP